MCGINGIYAKHATARIQERIARMNVALTHRGPDVDEYWDNGVNIALGHRRLPIIDLNIRANQPMRLANGKWIIVFDGKIFNFRAIREELKEFYMFSTETDTEVVLAAIEFKGLDWLLKRANGMFAFACYNTATNELYLARDRFGIKPLYYAECNGQLLFSSEIKGILHSGLIQPSLNEAAIDEYLGNRYVREPFTFFREIYQLKASNYLYFQDFKKIKEVQYRQLPAINFSQEYKEPVLIEQLDDQLRQAFQRWFIADVRVGAYLSGGVDSSLTTALLSQYASQPVSTYVIGFEQTDFNEFAYARQVADLYHTHHNELLCEPVDYFADWEQLIHFKDAPLAVPNEIPLAQMSSALKKDMTVVISGEGADELFGGYGKIFRSAFDYNNHVKDSPSFYDYFIGEYEYVPRFIRDKYLTTSKDLRTVFDQTIQNDFSLYKNEENIFRFFHQYHVQGLLQRIDATTMQTGIEARAPFLDHELVEFVYTQIPYELKLCWNSHSAEEKAKTLKSTAYSEHLDTPKYILKKVAEKYLPHDIIYRKKMGFPVPLTNWFKDLHKLSAMFLQDAGWLQTTLLPDLIKELESNPRSGQLLWMFVNVQMFYNQYFNKNWLW